MKRTIFSILLILTIPFSAFSETKKSGNVISQDIKSSQENLEISVNTAKTALSKKTHVFIDVREDWEYKEGHIPGIKLISLGNIEKEAQKLDKKVKYITVCAAGRRSKKAAEQMKKIGLNVVSMQGGMMKWQEKNYPVETKK